MGAMPRLSLLLVLSIAVFLAASVPILDEESYLAITVQFDVLRPYHWWRPWPPWFGGTEPDAFVYAHPPLFLTWVAVVQDWAEGIRPVRLLASIPPAALLGWSAGRLLEGLTRRRFYGRADFPRIAGLAFDADSFQAHLDEQLGRIQEDTHPDLKQLIADSLVREPGDRLTSAELADRCEQLVDQLSGPTLARWCRGRTWRPESDELAELSGRTLTEGTRPSVSAPPSAVPEHPGARTGSLQETSLGSVTFCFLRMLLEFLGRQMPSLRVADSASRPTLPHAPGQK